MLPHDHIGIPSFSAGNSKQAFRRNFPKGIPSLFKGPLSLSRPLFQGFPAFFKRSLCFPSVIFQEIPMPFSRNRRDRHNNRFPKRYPLCRGHMIIRSLSLSLPLSLTSHIHINIHLPKHARLHASAIAPFCSRLMRHQVHSGIPPSLPTMFEGRHFCSTRASIYSTSFARISYTNGNSCLNANIQLQSLTPSQMPPRLECVFADACQLGRRLLTLLAIQPAELRRPKRFAPRNVFCFLCNQTPDA